MLVKAPPSTQSLGTRKSRFQPHLDTRNTFRWVIYDFSLGYIWLISFVLWYFDSYGVFVTDSVCWFWSLFVRLSWTRHALLRVHQSWNDLLWDSAHRSDERSHSSNLFNNLSKQTFFAVCILALLIDCWQRFKKVTPLTEVRLSDYPSSCAGRDLWH